MATYIPLIPVPLQFMDSNGDPLSGGVLEFYLAGTTTPANLYSDSSGTSIGTSITLNSDGYPESGGNIITLFRDTAVDYKIIALTAAAVTIWTSDELGSALDVLASTSNGDGASLVGIEDAAENFTATDVEGALAEIYSDLGSTDTSLGASLVGIEDAAGYFSSSTVEGALAEFRALTIYRTKASDTSRASTTTVANDPDLTYAITAAGTYRFEVQVNLDGDSGGTQGIDANVNYSGTQANGTRMVYGGYINGSSLGTVNVAVAATVAAVTTAQGDVSATNYSNTLRFVGTLIASTAGTLAFAWAQNASETDALIVRAGSFMTITRLS